MRFSINNKNAILEKFGLSDHGKTQAYLDKLVLDYSTPYVPVHSGKLRRSGYYATVLGSGVITYGVPYARRQYYENKGSKGLCGPYWLERMKADRKNDIERAVLLFTRGFVT